MMGETGAGERKQTITEVYKFAGEEIKYCPFLLFSLVLEILISRITKEVPESGPQEATRGAKKKTAPCVSPCHYLLCRTVSFILKEREFGTTAHESRRPEENVNNSEEFA
jgi:hypothetical protein